MVSRAVQFRFTLVLTWKRVYEFESLVELFLLLATRSICQLTLASVETSEQGGC